jgi:hypothetical protein
MILPIGVTDKQCQKIVRTVIQRFLQCECSKSLAEALKLSADLIACDCDSIAKQFQQPQLESTFRASKEEGERGSIVIVAVLFAFVIWSGPMLSIPPAYFRRLREVAARADKGEYLPHLWNTLIKGLLKEWNDLNIVVSRRVAACSEVSLTWIYVFNHPFSLPWYSRKLFCYSEQISY